MVDLSYFYNIWSAIWWIIIPIFLGSIFWGFWLFYIRTLYISNLKWVMLRVRTPKEMLKTPKAMEQVFSAAYGTYTHGLRFSEAYWDGMVEHWTSFELVGYSGGVSFYIRCIDRFQHLFEAAVYAQYPEAEIDIMEDYTSLLPSVLPNNTYDLWGADMILARNDAYPIRTFPYWEALVSEEKVDTMSSMLEVLSKLREGEMVWMQILLTPTNDGWIKKSFAEVIKKVAGSGLKKEVKKSFFSGPLSFMGEFFQNLIKAPFKDIEWSDPKEEKEEKITFGNLPAGEKDAIKAMEEKMSKLAFETEIRWLYIARREVFNGGIISSVLSSFRQFNTFNLNAFKVNKPTLTIARQPFRRQKIYYKKRQLYDRYRFRFYPPHRKFSMLNIEELATVYHYPGINVEAPMLRRAEAKKGGPPPSLPVE